MRAIAGDGVVGVVEDVIVIANESRNDGTGSGATNSGACNRDPTSVD